MSLTDRDRKIVLLLAPLLLVVAYWFLLLAPKREEVATAGDELAIQEQRRDDADVRLAALASAQTDFAADYAELIRLGKAVPTVVDMPTVIFQLEDSARGTDIKFTRIAVQERVAAVPAAPEEEGAPPVAAGGEPAQSQPGTAVESANDTAAEQSGVAPGDTQTSAPANDGALPVGGGTAGAGGATAAGAGVVGLDTIGLELEFTGNFLDLSDFFHRVKRYVELDGDDLAVRGRLLTVDGVEFKSRPDIFPRIVATLNATVYLAPEIEGGTAGASPDGPAVTPIADAATGAVTPPPDPAAAE